MPRWLIMLGCALAVAASSSCEEHRTQVTGSIVGTWRSNEHDMPFDIEPRLSCVLVLRADHTFDISNLPTRYQRWDPDSSGVRDFSGRWNIGPSETLEGAHRPEGELELFRRADDAAHECSTCALVFRASGRDEIQFLRQGDPEVRQLRLFRDPDLVGTTPR